MKRYVLIDVSKMGYPEADLKMVEHPDGEWVKYKDVKKKVDAYDDWVDRGIWLARETDPIICNCVEMCEELWRYWQCPAHGYKKR